MKNIQPLALFVFGLFIGVGNVLQAGAMLQQVDTKLDTDTVQLIHILSYDRIRIHGEIAQILLQFIDLKDKKNSVFYLEKISILLKELTPPFDQDEKLLIDLITYLNSSESKKHMNFNSWDTISNMAYWVNQVTTEPLNKAMSLILKFLNNDIVVRMHAPDKKSWKAKDVNIALIITTKALYK